MRDNHKINNNFKARTLDYCQIKQFKLKQHNKCKFKIYKLIMILNKNNYKINRQFSNFKLIKIISRRILYIIKIMRFIELFFSWIFYRIKNILRKWHPKNWTIKIQTELLGSENKKVLWVYKPLKIYFFHF